MTNLYLELKKKHEKEFNEFPMIFAFSKSQFKEGMEKLGLTEEDTDQIYSTGNGGYYKKTDAQKLKELFDRHKKEREENLSNEEYLYQMFLYELGNHEYCITYELDDTLEACDISHEMLEENSLMKDCLLRAKKKYLESVE